VTTRITGYERRRVQGQDLLATEPLDLPPSAFESTGLWLEMPLEVPAALEASQRHVMGGIHAVEHAALSLFPLFALCDRHDVAGISYTRHPQLGRPAIFLYDAHPGGVGISSGLFERVEALLEATALLIDDCPCDDGCPGCVHSPKCSNGNRPIDKTAAREVLALLLGHEPLPALPPRPAPAPEPPAPRAPAAPSDPRRVHAFPLRFRGIGFGSVRGSCDKVRSRLFASKPCWHVLPDGLLPRKARAPVRLGASTCFPDKEKSGTLVAWRICPRSTSTWPG
jgi:DEAD/DEAH box helicase domain-containing protein